jgi:Arc/MetJ family transcription regulator
VFIRHENSVRAELVEALRQRARPFDRLASIGKDINTPRQRQTHLEAYDMRTHIVLDDLLIQEALSVSGAASKREVVDLALRELVVRASPAALRWLVGKSLIDPAYDVRATRGAGDHQRRNRPSGPMIDRST